MAAEGERVISNIGFEQVARTSKRIEKYKDRPMDLADSTLLALAEENGLTRIFSLDFDFCIYRMANGRALEVFP
jgi:predicted nucleic acid-binding protein